LIALLWPKNSSPNALLSYLLPQPSTGDADFSRGRFPQGYESDLACAPRIRKTFSFTFAG